MLTLAMDAGFVPPMCLPTVYSLDPLPLSAAAAEQGI